MRDMANVKRAAVLVVISGMFVQAFAGTCKNDPRVTQACITVHGRLGFYNGTPSTRMWAIGTHHMFSVPTEKEEMPKYLRKLVPTFDDEVYGDFLVCPYKKRLPEHMQPVCVESGKNLVHKLRIPRTQ